jgi:subtilase family serine protease
MRSRTPPGFLGAAFGILMLLGPISAGQLPAPQSVTPLPDYDVRQERRAATPAPGAAAELQRHQPLRGRRGARLHPHSGGLRVLDAPGISVPRNAAAAAISGRIVALADRLGLAPADLSGLTLVRDYVSASNGLRHVVFSQSFDGVPVFDGVLSVHIDREGDVVRVTSGVGRGSERSSEVLIPDEEAASRAAAHVRPWQPFAAVRKSAGEGPRRATRFEPGPFLRDVAAELTWLPDDGGLRLAWRFDIEPDGEPQRYDVLIDAQSGDVLVRRNRVRYADGIGRVLQSAATQAIDPRRPDEAPLGAGSCPPALNFDLRSLNAQFRDPATVLFGTGRLAGNNARAFHGDRSTEAPAGTFDGSFWTFDFPFSSPGAAATSLFFAVNYAHDFFYALGFDEGAGNFQVDNFGRGGLGGDEVHVVARAAGRNNATFQTEPDGTNPIISMFMWDGTGCWAEDLNGDGSLDLDGDYDLDIILHEFHHGVSHRLNTAFTGSEADAIGEGGSDFFAYSVNGDTTLAEYAWPGGLRSINAKTYADWVCLFWFYCSPHENGQIFANVLWDLRERLRTELVGGSEGAGIDESHQLYVDALKLSPPAPTMLDMRDSLLLADEVRNSGSPHSGNFCRLWESFAERGMGVSALDTADQGANEVTAAFDVPDGCEGPPPPPTVTLAVVVATATEAGPTSASFTVSRAAPANIPLTVNLTIGGSGKNGVDYITISAVATIPGGAASVSVPITPIDDMLLESNETVTLSVRSGSGYVVGSPSTGTVTIVSDDVAPDLTLTALTAPSTAGPGATVSVNDNTRNQGTGPSGPSMTAFYLSTNSTVSSDDQLLGSREVPNLAIGSSSAGTTSLTLPAQVTAGPYYILAKADGPGEWTETNETNNVRLSLVRVGPDLVVTSLSGPSTAAAGGVIVVTDSTANQGIGLAAASQTRFYLSSNASWDDGDAPLQTRAVPMLDTAASNGGSTAVTIPAGTATGTHYLIAKADAAGSVVEGSETNNTRTLTLNVGPDLQVSALTAPVRGGSGGVIAITDTTRNAGAAGAGSSVTAFYLSSNFTLDAGDVRLASARVVGPIAGGGAATATTNVTLPTVAPGTWYLVARADDQAAVLETVETNNTRFASIAIGPDLDVITLSSPSTATAGTSVGVSDTVKNLGRDTAGASVTRFYLSLDYSFDGSDVLIGQRSLPELPDSVTNMGSATLALPTSASGRYYLIAVADGAGTVAESSESNNVLSKLITINPPQ